MMKINRHINWILGIVAIVIVLAFYNAMTVTVRRPSNEFAEQQLVGNKSSIVIIVDFSKPSMDDRLYIYDSKIHKYIYSGAVQHGRGGKSTARHPEFSNKIGSRCSSLGLYELTKSDTFTPSFFNKQLRIPCIRIKGLSSSNSNAEARGIYIHPGIMVSLRLFRVPGLCLPLSASSEGCFTVSFRTFRRIKKLMTESDNEKIILLATG